MWYSKSVGLVAVVAAFLASLTCNVMARGVGQGEHEADTRGGLLFGGGYSYAAGVGQGQFEPAGPDAAAVPSGINIFAVGQAQHDAQEYYYAPSFDVNSRYELATFIATQPSAGREVVSDPHYRYANGKWFYQMPDNSWMRWENGIWVNAERTVTNPPKPVPIASRTLPGERR